jgi:hypothetical protein
VVNSRPGNTLAALPVSSLLPAKSVMNVPDARGALVLEEGAAAVAPQ